jgi:hypothetical protein
LYFFEVKLPKGQGILSTEKGSLLKGILGLNQTSLPFRLSKLLPIGGKREKCKSIGSFIIIRPNYQVS